MAYIEFLHSNTITHLRDYHTFGRRIESVDTPLRFSVISKLHAVIEWKKPYWLIKDLSSNGVSINGKPISPKTSVILTQGDVVEFAQSKETAFTIANLDAPENLIYQHDNPLSYTPLNDSTLLPNDTQPQLGIYKCPERQQWFAEEFNDDDESLHLEQGPYKHGDTIQWAEQSWSLFLVNEYNPTTEFSIPKNINDIEFRFDISLDEETTELTLIYQNNEIDLAQRSHHYLLATLLRHREQHKNQYDDPSSGWVDTELLCNELGIDQPHMNIQIFRARKQISDALPDFTGRSKLIQRRRGSLRFGVKHYSIYKEGVKEA